MAHEKVSAKVPTPLKPQSSALLQKEDMSAVQLQRFLQNPSLSPHMIDAAQRQLGNQGLQRLMRQAEVISPVSLSRPHSLRPHSLQRTPLIHHRTGRSVIQRGPISYLKKKIKKWINNKATEATFGTDQERQANPSENYLDIRDQNAQSFSGINNVEVPSGAKGEHKLKGRHYLAKDPSKGAYAGKTILFLSGSGGVAEDYSKDSAIYYCKEGANLLAVNYRGFGRSTTSDDKGKNRKMGHNELKDTMLYEDSRSMFRWLTGTGVDAGSVIVHGYSLGGAMAANLVSTLADEGVRVGGLVFHSAIDSARNVAVRSQGSFMGGIGADNLGSDFDTLGAMKALAKNHPDILDMPIAAFSGSKDAGGRDQGDHLDDGVTNLSGQMTGMGFNNVGSKTRSDRTHAPNHLESFVIGDLVKQQFGSKEKPKAETLVEDGVKEL